MKMKLQVCAAILPPFCWFCQSKNASDISPIRSIKVALLGPFCKHSRATTLPPFVRACSCHFADPARPKMLLPFCQADQRWHANAAIWSFCRSQFSNHVGSNRTTRDVICSSILEKPSSGCFARQSRHKAAMIAVKLFIIPWTVGQSDFVCRMYICICLHQHYMHTYMNIVRERVCLSRLTWTLPWHEPYHPLSDSIWTSWFILLKARAVGCWTHLIPLDLRS